ncbi:phosphatase PAP2 family protein [Candidatus Woesearchaeota archaeon]|nr:phosphatase PAP2 family protein [Candidatus Woesearchaeota archaeon]
MEKKRNINRKFLVAAVVAAALLAASFLLDDFAAATIKSIQTPGLTGIVTLFDRLFVWIYLALLATTTAVILKNRPMSAAASKSSLSGKMKENRVRSIFILSASIITTIAAVYLLKLIFQRERPDGALVKTLFGLKDYAFPSAHVATASAAAVSSPAAMRVPWLFFTAAVLFSRIYLNVHFLSDTIGGLIIAAVVGWFVNSKLKEKLTVEDMTEVRRQVMHALIGLLIAAFVWKYPQFWPVVVAIAAAGLALSYAIKSAATARSKAVKALRKLTSAALELVERKEELRRFPGMGAITLFLGSGITAAIFRQEAVAAIIILAIGDSVSHLAGRLIGRMKHKRPFIEEKMVEGTVVGFVFAAAAAATILPAWMAILAAAAGMAVEAMHVKILGKRIDDNLTVPLVAAAVIWGIKYLF